MELIYAMGYIVISITIYIILKLKIIDVEIPPLIVSILWLPLGILQIWIKYKSYISKNNYY